MRLQTVVSREIGRTDTAVVTVGALRAGTAVNIIPDDAELLIGIRTFTAPVRTKVMDSIARIIRAEATASAAPRDPDIDLVSSFPAVVNDDAAAAHAPPSRGSPRWSSILVRSPEVKTSVCSRRRRGPLRLLAARRRRPGSVHRREKRCGHCRAGRAATFQPLPLYAPVVQPTLTNGVSALVVAARTWLAPA